MIKRIFFLILLVSAFMVAPVAADTTYIVQPGDTLSKIAAEFGTTVAEIVAANNIENPNVIRSGQELIIPEGKATTATTTTTTTTTTTGGTTHTVQTGDSLSKIAAQYGVTVISLVEANNIANVNLITVGQVLQVPGGVAAPVTAAPITPAATTTAAAPAPAPAATPSAAAPTTGNLFPNPSFEGDWHFEGASELQIPNGWQVYTDEGANTLEPSDGGTFLRPEIRVVPASDLPASEHGTFIFGGLKTVKAFKGGAPTNFAIFTDIVLQPGKYRMTINFFPDVAMSYADSGKVYATNPLFAEMRIVHNSGGPGWQTTNIGQRNTVTYEFTVTQAGTVRLGAGFRNRFVAANNGWFLDEWSLVKIN